MNLREREPFEDIQAISLDAMGTIILLKRNAQEIYGEILRDLGYDPQKIMPLTRDPGLFRRYWREAERRLPPSFLSEHVDRFAHYRETPYAFWGLIFRVMVVMVRRPEFAAGRNAPGRELGASSTPDGPIPARQDLPATRHSWPPSKFELTNFSQYCRALPVLND